MVSGLESGTLQLKAEVLTVQTESSLGEYCNGSNGKRFL
jgi:hypothetical protein